MLSGNLIKDQIGPPVLICTLFTEQPVRRVFSYAVFLSDLISSKSFVIVSIDMELYGSAPDSLRPFQHGSWRNAYKSAVVYTEYPV